MPNTPNGSTWVIRSVTLVILAAVCSIGIVNLAYGRWLPALTETTFGTVMVIFFAAQWMQLTELAKQRREPPYTSDGEP